VLLSSSLQHVWLANLLYNEQLAWPFDLYLTETSAVDADGNLVFAFRIPIFAHTEIAGNLFDDRDVDTSKATELRPQHHTGWASYGAAQWFVFCNAFHFGATDGMMRVSPYIAQDDLHLDDAPPVNLADQQTFLSGGVLTTRWDLGVSLKWFGGNNVSS
jgi:hypothetical protein